MSQAVKRKLDEDVKWRTEEIALIKKSALRKDQTALTKVVQRRYSVPSMYAIWEGFIITAFSTYVEELNLLAVPVSGLQRNLLAFNLFKTFSLYEPPKDYTKRVTLAESIREHMKNVGKYSTPIETNSNVDYNELMFLMKRFAISAEGLEEYKSPLMKMISLRNKIAHGQRDVNVTEKNVNEFSLLIEGLMGEVAIRINEALENKAYLISSS